MKKILFTNILGNFVFGQNFTPIDEDSEAQLKKKHTDLEKPDEKELKRILEYFKDRRFFNGFYEKNLALTKKAVKDSFSRDILVSQASASIDELGKAAHLLTKRLKEWYSYYCPEIGEMEEEKIVKAVIDKKQRGEMGAEFSKDDLNEMGFLAVQINKLHELREREEKYLDSLMKGICPNLLAVAGRMIGAKLIGLAGSLKKLAEMPSSTIQVLGAEKAMFRHVRNKKARPPKHGVIHEHPLLLSAKKNLHGRVARSLADKICLAAKVDYFRGKFIGEKLRNGLEEKFK